MYELDKEWEAVEPDFRDTLETMRSFADLEREISVSVSRERHTPIPLAAAGATQQFDSTQVLTPAHANQRRNGKM